MPPSLPARSALAPLALVFLLAGCGGGGSDPVAATAGATLTAPAGAVPGAPAAASVLGWIAPASLPQFDLSAWKLNLPVDADGGTTGPAQTLSPEQLVAGYASAWFHADAQGRIVFTAPANGAVTTPGVGTDHTRSELREFRRDANADADGYGTGAGTLSASCSVLAAASAAKTVIIGQLRSRDHNLAMLVFRPATGEVAIDVYARPETGAPHAASTLLAGVALGAPLQYTLSIAGGTLVASANGASHATVLDPSWAGVPLAFKLGAYHTAPNTGNPPGDATVVACSAFALTH